VTRKTSLARGIISSFAALLAVLLLSAASAMAQASSDGALLSSYYDMATSTAPSASGWGGPGWSGGAGQELVRVVNPTKAVDPMCAMFYVFDDEEQMQACCGCPVSANDLLTVPATVLTSNLGVNGANVAAGTIEIISATPNFTKTPGVGLPFGINLYAASPSGCDPTASTSSSLGNSFGTARPVEPLAGLRATMSHSETTAPSSPPFTKFTTSTSVNEFQRSSLDPTQQSSLISTCYSLLSNSSGSGGCFCGIAPRIDCAGGFAVLLFGRWVPGGCGTDFIKNGELHCYGEDGDYAGFACDDAKAPTFDKKKPCNTTLGNAFCLYIDTAL